MFERRSISASSILEFAVAVAPAILVFGIMMILTFGTNTSGDLFFARSTRGVVVRFLLVTVILFSPILLLSGLLRLVGKALRNGFFSLQLVNAGVSSGGFSRLVAWFIRPFQGIGLSMIFARNILGFLEYSSGTSYAGAMFRPVMFLVDSALASILLCVIWSLDDLSVRIYNRKTTEVHMAGSYVGGILPLLFGAIGVYSLFEAGSPAAAVASVVEIVMVLYPPYVLFAVIHHKFVRRHKTTLLDKLQAGNVEVKAW